MYEPPNLTGLVGQIVGMAVPSLKSGQTIRLKIHAIETAGIWVESQEKINEGLATLGRTSGPATPLFFLPYSSIQYIVASVAMPSLADQIAI